LGLYVIRSSEIIGGATATGKTECTAVARIGISIRDLDAATEDGESRHGSRVTYRKTHLLKLLARKRRKNLQPDQ
jgi:hypothetical protein